MHYDVDVEWERTLKLVLSSELINLKRLLRNETGYFELASLANAHASAHEARIDNEALFTCNEATVRFEDYVVFGLFRKNPSVFQLLDDAKPLIYIGIYSIWAVVTKEFLILTECEKMTEQTPE